MLFGKKDRGETRSFECEDQFYVGRSGKLRQATSPELDAAVRAIVADILCETAEQLEHEIGEFRRQSRAVVEAAGFQAMVSGS